MARFIEPKVRIVHRQYFGEHQNNPVNIDLCTELVSCNKKDGYGKVYPVIEFMGCGVIWYFGEKGHQLRDEQYNEILAIREGK